MVIIRGYPRGNPKSIILIYESFCPESRVISHIHMNIRSCGPNSQHVMGSLWFWINPLGDHAYRYTDGPCYSYYFSWQSFHDLSGVVSLVLSGTCRSITLSWTATGVECSNPPLDCIWVSTTPKSYVVLHISPAPICPVCLKSVG